MTCIGCGTGWLRNVTSLVAFVTLSLYSKFADGGGILCYNTN